MKFCFGDIVVVEEFLIGVVVKCWHDEQNGTNNYDVYVRSYSEIQNYHENEMERYMVRHKELNVEEMLYQKHALE